MKNAGTYHVLMHTAHKPALPISSWVHPSLASEDGIDRNNVEIESLLKIKRIEKTKTYTHI